MRVRRKILGALLGALLAPEVGAQAPTKVGPFPTRDGFPLYLNNITHRENTADMGLGISLTAAF